MRDCKHGQLARKCELCDNEQHVAELEHELAIAMNAIYDLVSGYLELSDKIVSKTFEAIK